MVLPGNNFALVHKSFLNDVLILIVLVSLSFLVMSFVRRNKKIKIDWDILYHVEHGLLAYLIIALIAIIYNSSELMVMILSSIAYVFVFIISYLKKHR